MHKVLIVDDEPLVRASIQGLGDWAEQGFDMGSEARNGDAAIGLISSEHFDVVLLDMNMPRCDGICFLKKLREVEQNPVVVVISAFDEFSLVREAFTLGAVDYLLKADISFDKVKDTLTKAVDRLEKGSKDFIRERPVDERLQQQILKDFLTRDNPVEFTSLLEELGLVLHFPCLPVQFRLTRGNETLRRFMRSSLESRSNGLFASLSDTDMIWLYYRTKRQGLTMAEEAELLSREIAELTKQSLNADFEWAVGETVRVIEEVPAAIRSLGSLFSNVSRPVHRAKAYIRKHYRDPDLNLAAVAEYAGVSRTHLSSLFSKELAMGFSDYLIRVRIDAAKELLIGSVRRVYEVAEEVGYGSVEQFSRMFKRITGTTPNRFQAESQDNQS